MSIVDLGTSSLHLQQIEDALNSADLTGWKFCRSVVVVLAMAYPVGILVRRLTIRELKRVPNLPAEVAEDGDRIAAWLVYLIRGYAYAVSAHVSEHLGLG